jgi:GNAT superfamily N-acetyltransferase
MMVRRATVDDARGIAEVNLRGWQIGYRDFINSEYLRSLDWMISEQGLQRRQQSLADASQTTLVAEEDTKIVGFAGFGPNRDGLDDSIGELHGIYVDPDVWNRGIGTALIEAAEVWLTADGFTSAILWTLGANQRTRRFYENRGWHFDGARLFHKATATERVRYTKDLRPSIGDQ